MADPTYRIQHRRGTAAEWTSANPILASGEWGFETDTKRLKIGDATTRWSSLAYFGGSPSDAAPKMAGVAAAGTGTKLSRDDHVHPSDTSHFPKAGGTVEGNVFARHPAGTSVIAADGFGNASTNYGEFRLTRNYLDRWIMRTTNNVEPADESGSDFLLASRSDDGSAKHNILQVLRKTGVTLNYKPTAYAFGTGFVTHNPHATSYRSALSTETGYILITMPPAGNTNTMMQLRLRGYDYSPNGGEFEFNLGGYTYQTTPAWFNTSARVAGTFDNATTGVKSHPVRWLHKGAANNAQFAIAIGYSGTIWKYPQLVLEVLAGHSSAQVGYSDEYSISIVSSLSGWTEEAVETPSVPQGRVPLPGEMRYLGMATQSLTTGVNTTLTGLAVGTGDTGDGATTLSGGNLTLNESGYWDVSVYFNFAANTSGLRQIDLQINGNTAIREKRAPDGAGGCAGNLHVASFYAVANSVMSIVAYQTSGADLNFQNGQWRVRRMGEYY